ncbi:MAG: hypothetical protein E6Q25_08605 [Acinetobacter sp.]|nr:MAG: hypothetical protein E6Q25_08605 [Acinetobacter sp.]
MHATSQYPLAIDENMVGAYPAWVKSGAGYFYDDVLEYRVWCHPERGAADEHEGQDYYRAFVNFEQAQAFSEQTQGAEPPLVLVRQSYWVNEPETGVFVANRGERLTEWQVAWLERGKRQDGDIEQFFAERGAVFTGYHEVLDATPLMRDFNAQAYGQFPNYLGVIACCCVIEGRLPVRWVSHAGGDWQMYCHVDAHDFSDESTDFEQNIQLTPMAQLLKYDADLQQLYDLAIDKGAYRDSVDTVWQYFDDVDEKI